ncbi:MAG: (d)CMP kinase [Parachlamydiaceae bacterium]|nr:(d)CMP kinase [Parachlamydiaceae bacterium]
MIITIDGPVATGKSTIAKKLAEELGYIFFDTGAMYRAFTWLAIQKNYDLNNPEDLEKLINGFAFNIKNKKGERHYFIDQEDITQAIRAEAVTSRVSAVSANPEIREKLVSMQRNFASGVNAVFEGRDMGTVVFPNADMKIFLTARPEVRAKRRFDELKAKFPNETQNLTLEMALEDLNRRDNTDSTRVHSPLKQAEDAILVDTSDLNIDGVVIKILEIKDSLKAKKSLK